MRYLLNDDDDDDDDEEEKVFIANSKGMVWMMDTFLHPRAEQIMKMWNDYEGNDLSS